MSAPNRRRLTKAERHRQLLAHAKKLLLTLGYPQTTLEKIADVAGVRETVVQRHFENPKAIIVEVLQELRVATVARWTTETAALADPPAKLHAIVDLYLAGGRELCLEFRLLHRLLVECVDEEEIRTLVRDYYEECQTLLAAIIAEGQQSGVFRRSLDPRVGAWELIHTALGYTLLESLGVPLYGESDYLPQAIECLLHCLLKTDV